MNTLTIDLPDNLLQEAKEAGLLNSQAIETAPRENLHRCAVDSLFLAADKLTTANFPLMTMDEIQQEVDAVRAQRKQHASGTGY